MERTIRKIEVSVPVQPRLKRVAAYARVSSGKDAMLHSLSAQVSFYSKLIQSHKGWQYCGVYSDEAFTGTKENREGFQQLLNECRLGHIDMIITKSISRFARNTVTLLQTVRELKMMDVDVYFEEQNIHTLSADGELMMTILASYAQEESLSASENRKWQIRRGFQNGELVNMRFMFGYRVRNEHMEIDSDTGEIVREIFSRVINRESLSSIARDLNTRNISGVFGGKWNTVRVKDIITNEKYTGNALLQKHYINNHLEKKRMTNTGQLPQYYAEETHPAIIDSATFEAAQEIIKEIESTTANRAHPQKRPFTSKIICGKCGSNFKRTKNNRCPGWDCSLKLTNGISACRSKKIPESTLISITNEVLGTTEFDAELFGAEIDHIEVPIDNHLKFYFKNGSVEERTWKDRSRRESWTPEMKERTAERVRQQRRNQKCQK